MVEALLFDLDGTLTHTDPLHFRVWQEKLKAYGLDITREFYDRHFTGRLNPDIVRDILPQLSVVEEQQLSESKEALFREWAIELRPLPGLLDLLDWAETQSLKMAVVTNAPRKNAAFMLEGLGLTQRLQPVILADELPQGKPHPMAYQQALTQLGVEPEQAIAFEDSTSGLKSAVGAGIFTVGITSTRPGPILKEAGASLVISDFTAPQLQTLLDPTVAAA